MFDNRVSLEPCPSIFRPNPVYLNRRRNLSKALSASSLDRVRVLEGHTGCVNALSWAREGELLISGGDDTTVRIWRVDPTIEEGIAFPFYCRSTCRTGHRGNIFAAKMLPYSSRIATVSADSQVRVVDVGEAHGPSTSSDLETTYSTNQCVKHIFRCHGDRTKRITITDDSPDTFLTVGEDGAVRQHDLRRPHSCRHSECSPPLMKSSFELSALTTSPMAPYHFVVAGSSPYGYLFDRRNLRSIRQEWGQLPDLNEDSLTSCVRRFGRPPAADGSTPRRRHWREHITGARMSKFNGHEILLTYSGDAVYSYSTRDDIEDQCLSSRSTLSPNPKRRKLSPPFPTEMSIEDNDHSEQLQESDAFRSLEELLDGSRDEDDSPEENDEEADSDEEMILDAQESKLWFKAPTVLPRMCYKGARNVQTVKDVNFLGPEDEYVTSGSDDGNFFIWDKRDGKLRGIYEGDSSVVNVIEGHPHLPLVAVSGIDTTVKLFAPTTEPKSQFSRIGNAERIMETNARPTGGLTNRFGLMALLASAHAEMVEDGNNTIECTNQ